MYMYNNFNKNYSQCEPNCSCDCGQNDYMECKELSYADFLKEEECQNCDPQKSKNALLCYQAWMSRCEAKLFCEATTRLSYELCKARSFWEVKQVIESISCLFSSSAIKETALADVIKSFNCTKCCDCDCCCDSPCWFIRTWCFKIMIIKYTEVYTYIIKPIYIY